MATDMDEIDRGNRARIERLRPVDVGSYDREWKQLQREL